MSNYKFGYNLPSNNIYYRPQSELSNCVITSDSLEELKNQAETKGLKMEAFKTSVANYCCTELTGCKVTPKPWKSSMVGGAIGARLGELDWCSDYQSINFISTPKKDMLNLSDPYASWKTKEIQKGDKVYLNPKLGPIEMEVLEYNQIQDTVKVLFRLSLGLERVVVDVKRSDLIPYFED